jgi:hypothetical protein
MALDQLEWESGRVSLLKIFWDLGAMIQGCLVIERHSGPLVDVRRNESTPLLAPGSMKQQVLLSCARIPQGTYQCHRDLVSRQVKTLGLALILVMLVAIGEDQPIHLVECLARG